MRGLRTVVAALLAAAVLAAPSPHAAERTLDRIAAVIDDEIITHRELAAAVARFRRMLEERQAEMPSEKVLASQALQELIVRKLQLQEAARRGVAVTEPQLDQAMENLAARNKLSLAQLKERVEGEGGDYAAFREDVREQVIIGQLRQREVTDKIEVSEKEIEDYMSERDIELEYRFTRVGVALPAEEEARDKARAWLRALRDEARDGGGFGRVAQRAAQGRKGVRFRDFGWQRAEDLPAALAARAPRMDTGEFAPLIRTGKALYLYKLEGKRGGNLPATVERQYNARHILMAPNAMDTDEVIRRKLRAIKKRLDNGGDFGKYAKRYSQDPGSSFKGGSLGWVSPKSMVAEVAEKMQNSPRDEVVGPFRSSFGWHLLQVLGVREHNIGDETWRRQAVAAIRQRKSEEEYRSWMLRLRERRYVDIRL